MARTSKNAPTRRPAKAKGTLPAPKVGPRRLLVPWHRRTPFRVAGGVVIVSLLGVAAWQVLRVRAGAAERREAQGAVRQFERRLNLLQSSLQEVAESMSSDPERFRSGEMPAEEFKAATDTWLQEFRRMVGELQGRQVPPELEESKALYIQGATIYIDAIKAFQLAAAAEDPALREQAIDHGSTVFYHAGFVLGNGQRALQEEKRRLGIDQGAAGEPLDLPIQIPQEDPPGRPAPAPSPAPG